MRKLCAGWMVAVGLCCSVTLAQNNPATQPGAAGQKQGNSVTGDSGPGQPTPGPAAANQAGQRQATGQNAQGQTNPGQPVQGQTVQGQNTQGQAGQNQFGQGQQSFQQRQGGQTGQAGQGQATPGQRSARSDQEIAACVYGECSNEIEIAKLGEQKAQNDAVRDFAKKMISDHSPGCQEMQRLAGNLASQQAGQQAALESDGGLDWVSVKKQIGQQCLATIKQELSQKPSGEFDHCFMGQQIVAHLKVIDELKVLRNYASQELREKLDKELEGAQHHLHLAKQIEQKLKDNPSERVSRRPDGNK